VIRLEQRAPGAVVDGVRHAMAKEIEVERPGAAGADFAGLGPHLIRREQGARQRAKRAARDRRGAQLDSAGAGHRRLDERMLGPDEVEPAAVGPAYHSPVFGIAAHGSAEASAAPFWRSSIEILSGLRTNAMRPSRGGRLMVTPASIRRRPSSPNS